MLYECLDCTHKGRHFPDGVCPGCGSARIQKQGGGGERRRFSQRRYRLALAVGLWLYLFVEIYRTLNA